MSDQEKEQLVDNTTNTNAQPVVNTEIEQPNTQELQSSSDNEIVENSTQEDEVEDFGYEREDSEEGVITNIPEITQQQATHITDVIYNGLLGEYDQYGKYTISTEITKELAHMPKHFVRKDKFGTYVQSKVGDMTFDFCVTPPVVKEDGYAYCYLQLLEEVSYTNGYIIDTKTTTVATYEYLYTDVFYDWVASAFNIDQDTEGEPDGGRKYVDTQYIALRLKYLKAIADMSIDLYEDLDESYFNQRLQILNELPEGTVILAEFNKERAKIEKYFLTNSRRKYKALNDLLNSILDGPAGMKIKNNAEYNQKMTEANQKYLQKVNEIHLVCTNSPEIKAMLQYEQPTAKLGFEDDMPKNTTKGDKYPKKKAGGKSKPPSVPKPDKYKMPKASKAKKDKKKDNDVNLDILKKYRLTGGPYKVYINKGRKDDSADYGESVFRGPSR